MKDKFRAWAIHLLLSACVVTPVLLVIFFLWFPQPWFMVQGTLQVVGVLIAVDLVLGPFLTFIVYRKGKKGLRFDLTVIILLQLVALAYGTWTIHGEQPRYLVYALDRFEALAEKDVVLQPGTLERVGPMPHRGPLPVFAQMPLGEAYQRFQESVLFYGQPDLERRPEFWIPYADGASAILAGAYSLETVEALSPEDALRIAAVAEGLDLSPERIRVVPLLGKNDAGFMALVHPETAEVLDAVPVGPWVWQRR